MRKSIFIFVCVLLASMSVKAQDINVTDFINYSKSAHMPQEATNQMWEAMDGFFSAQPAKTYTYGKALSDKGYAVGDFFLGWCYEGGEGGASRNDKESVRYFKKAATASVPFPWAYQYLAAHYNTGVGVSEDPQMAFYWYKKGAEAINYEFLKGNCLSGMAYAYQYGRSVKKDMEEAIRLYGQAAQLGDKTAMRNLSNRYAAGEGVEKNYAKALYWAEQAGQAGDADYLFLTAVTYLTGKFFGNQSSQPIVSVDKQKAISYLRKSASLGSLDAARVLRQIGK